MSLYSLKGSNVKYETIELVFTRIDSIFPFSENIVMIPFSVKYP